MHLQFVGCGDAFGSGGRFNTCFHLVGRNINALIDCGATSLVAMNKLAINRNDVDSIFLTHFHGDHVGGVPFFLLEANYMLKRDRPLTIVGPPSLKSRYPEIMETGFPGTKAMELQFPAACSVNSRSATPRRVSARVAADRRTMSCTMIAPGPASDCASRPKAK